MAPRRLPRANTWTFPAPALTSSGLRTTGPAWASDVGKRRGGGRVVGAVEADPNVCRHFLQGKSETSAVRSLSGSRSRCYRGQKCNFLHPNFEDRAFLVPVL